MKRLVVFSGAGTSAESGLRTFRDSGGLWEEFDIQEVATPEAWAANPSRVLEFYNRRREQVLKANPNSAHLALVKLEEHFDVSIVTQNIDDLHERAGSSTVLHLHGEITKARGSNGGTKLYPVVNDLEVGQEDDDGSQLRPHVVWFGEPVPEYGQACDIISKAEIVLIVGTSLNVYPAAGLIFHAPANIQMYLIDPAEVGNPGIPNLTIVKDLASVGVPKVVESLINGIRI